MQVETLCDDHHLCLGKAFRKGPQICLLGATHVPLTPSLLLSRVMPQAYLGLLSQLTVESSLVPIPGWKEAAAGRSLHQEVAPHLGICPCGQAQAQGQQLPPKQEVAHCQLLVNQLIFLDIKPETQG